MIMSENGKKTETSGVVLAPAGHFVFRSYDPVEGISAEEAREAALLAFEEEAPYPVEQLACGHYEDSSGRVAVWGCDRAVLPEAGKGGFLFPEFFALFGWGREEGTVEILESAEGGALLFFDKGGPLPTEIIGLRSDPGEPAFANEVGAAFRFLNRSLPDLDSIPRLSVSEVSSDSRGRFEAVVTLTDGAAKSWTLADESVWGADLRPTDEIKKFRTEKVAAERIWLGTRIAAGFLVFVGLLQIVSWTFGFWVGQKEETRQQQAPLVAGVEERANLASRLKDLGESRLSVFERLGDLNLARPDGIQFLDVRFDEPDVFRIEGRVNNVRVLNEFVSRLRSDARFVVKDAPPPRTRDGRVEFELAVQIPGGMGGQG